MTLEGVTKDTFDAAKFSAGMAAAFGVEADLIQVLGVTEVSRRHLLAAGVKVDFQIAAADASDATSIASSIEAKAPEDMANALKTAGIPVTAVAVANLAPTNLDAPAETPTPLAEETTSTTMTEATPTPTPTPTPAITTTTTTATKSAAPSFSVSKTGLLGGAMATAFALAW